MRTRILSAWLVGALPLAVSAQTPAVAGETKGAAAVGGTATIDYVTLRAGNLGAPLRFGHIMPGSETIQLGGRMLVASTDYAVDYETGVVYLKRAQRTGEQMVVAYRYDPQGKATGGVSFVGVNSFSGLSLAPGLGLVGGLGLAERAADGTVMSSNVFGWNNTLKFGPEGKSSLGGLFLYSDRQKNENQAGLSMDPNAKPGDATKEEGQSKFLLQNFRSALFGGNVSIDYQDISKNFASGSQVRSAGYSDADVQRLMKERGLKRQGASVNDLRFGSAKIGASFREVGDEKGQGVSWSSYGFQQGGLKLSMSQQRVDAKFARGGDLGDANHDQIARETGLSRQNLAMEFAQKAGKLSFNSSDVTDDKSDKHAVRREAKLDAGRIGLAFGDQNVDKAFSRVGSLTGAEQGQWGREVGAKRQWAGITAALGGKTTPQNFAFSQLDLKTDVGRFAARDATFASKTWSLDHVSMGAKGKTLPMGSLQNEEANGFVKRVAGFFGAPATNDSHRQNFLSAGDVQRDLTKLNVNPVKGTSLVADQLKFGQGEKGGVAESAALSTANVKASYRKQDFGKKFTDASRLLDFERAKLGTVAGLQRTDVSFGIQIDKARSFAFGQTKAEDATGDLGRTTVAYNAKGLAVAAAERNVSKGFASAAGLVDPENGLLAQFQGFRERDMSLNYSGTPALRIQAFLQDAENATTKEARAVSNADVEWKPDKLTDISYTSHSTKNADPLTTLFAQSLQRASIVHSFGTLATFKFVDEQFDNDGKNNPGADSHKQYFAVETKLDKKTSVRTEQTRTDFSDGNKEDISANTLSTSISKNMGVSATETSIDRKGDDKDEKKRNYGVWYDFGKGLRINYGFVENLVGETGGTGNEMLTFGQTPNTLATNQVNQVGASNIGGILVGGGYGENSFLNADPNAAHTQTFANFGLTTAKPFKFAGLTDLRLSMGLDSASDYSQYLRENKTMGLSGKLGSNTFSFGYRGQLANPNMTPNATSVGAPNVSAVDRSFALTTDPSKKAPIVVNGSVKVRTLPDDKDYTSRNITVTARPAPGIELSNQVQTNLEAANPNVLLGSTLLADRANKWSLGYRANPDTLLAATWEEKTNDSTDATSTLSALNLTLFQKSGNPLKLSYGLDQIDGNATSRQVTRYSLQYDTKTTGSQSFSLFVGNVGYAYDLNDGIKGDNWTLRMNYQIRF